MFDNTFVYLQAITDSVKEPVMDNHGNPIESRTYSGLLCKIYGRHTAGISGFRIPQRQCQKRYLSAVGFQ